MSRRRVVAVRRAGAVAAGLLTVSLGASDAVGARDGALESALPAPDDAGGAVGGPGNSAATLGSWRRAVANDDVATLARLLEVARASGDPAARPSAAALAAARTDNGKSALMVAAKRGALPLARALVAAGADPDERSATGGTPFMFAVLGDRLDTARWLREQGVALDARGSNGWSATTIAAAKGLDDMLAWLLGAGAPVDEADVYGFTPLMRAVDNAHAAAARRLLDAGARVDATDERGNTALHHAVADGRVALVRLLLDRGADPSLANRDGLTASALGGGAPGDRLPPALLTRLGRRGVPGR